jgi:multicomponent Na+:H+ antiporter subunit C
MTLLVSICVAVIFGVSVYLLLGRELKGIAMGLFLLSHGANLGILAMSGQPIRVEDGQITKLGPPILAQASEPVDPLPQALILTAIVISFAVTAFLLTLLVATYRRVNHLAADELANDDRPTVLTTP